MTCFQLVKSVLDEQYREIGGKRSERDHRIRRKLNYLRNRYAQLGRSPFSVSYRDPATRFAYICNYVTAHADYASSIISRTRPLRKLFDKPKVNITCVGGGPGSDLVGILKFVEENRKRPALRFTLFDKEPAWSESWFDVDDKLGTSLRTNVNFQEFDVASENTWRSHKKYLASDLFTFIYFVSETYSVRRRAAAYYRHLFRNAVSGALFLYIDNNAGCFSDWFEELCEQGGLRLVREESGVINTGADEEKTDLGKWYEKFGPVKLRSDVVYRVLRKG